ncbi:uncharacterized protein SOCE26_036930 [Sorangium cellulosum]|uniref:Uncharacterized protein n=1 Tax=Sorangium cellulosum TaxID=56 RepID=A0A2L0ESI8_SORCE|nr:uncharacterized protein SOCE26_036930 [Sorangium cellulosum]
MRFACGVVTWRAASLL